MYKETRGITKLRVTQRYEIFKILIPWFNNNSLQGRKALHFLTWIEIVNILVTEPKRTLNRDYKIDSLIKKISNI